MRLRRDARLAGVWGLLVVAWGAGLTSGAAVAQTAPAPACSPVCGAGETCVNGMCMVPARPPPPPVPYGSPYAVPAAPDAPAPYQPEVSTVRWHEGLVAMPFLGLNSFAGSSSRDIDIGFRVGGLLGSRMTENWSMNGELTFDVVNLNLPNVDTSAYMIEGAFAPLFHAPVDKVEIVLGPILGLWYLTESASSTLGLGSANERGWGWTIGANAGILFAINEKVHLGALFSFSSRNAEKVCVSGTSGGIPVPEQCQSSGLTAEKPFGFTLAAMF